MAIIGKDKKKKVKDAEVQPPEPPKEEIAVDQQCSYCDNKALFVGKFISNWFNLPVLMCKTCMANLINHNVAIEDLDESNYQLPDFPEGQHEVSDQPSQV